MNEYQETNKNPLLNDLDLALAIIERDTAQYRKERLDKLILEIQLKSSLLTEKPSTPKQNTAVNEINFNTLKFEPQEGTKLGDYELAYKQNNLPDKWQSAYNILRINNSTIKDRYHGEGYLFSYWLFGEGKIYRQKLKEKT
jgi:hypothetical protein